jgi:hypothetical protein
MTLFVAILAAALISSGFIWTLFHDLPELVRRNAILRQQRR